MSTSSANVSQAIQHLQIADPVLAAVIATHPAPAFTAHTNYYQELVESIISQQLSVKAAAAILSRFRGLFGEQFPSPLDILTKDVETYRSVGLSRQKATYILDLAAKVTDGAVEFDHLDTMSNEAIIEELTQIKGVGVWTVHMFLMFCMGRLDILPVGDLGIRNGIQALYGLDEKPSPEIIEGIAREHHWHPYESVACWYVWQSLNNTPALESVV
jgi:DNA-3-methyladenine glycosylase II